MIQAQQLSQLRRLQTDLMNADRRILVLVEGSPDWGLALVRHALQQLHAQSTLWFSQRATDQDWVLPIHKLNHELGREADHGVFDAYSGLYVDALAAMSGCIRGGGMLWMLCPELDEWQRFRDEASLKIAVEPWGVDAVKTTYANRVAWLLQQDAYVLRISETSGVAPLSLPAIQLHKRLADELGCVTPCQRNAVESVLHVVKGHRKRPLVIEADRGRGKSAALGIAISQLIQTGKHVVVTAPRPENVETLLMFARPGEAGTGSVEFFAPDRLLSTVPAADLLVVDEAAALAPEILKSLLRRYSRAVFATTVNGYEGTGRGFSVRFQRYLEEKYPGWIRQTLVEPVRWQQGDWLEHSLNNLLLMKPRIVSPEPSDADAELEFSEFHYQCETQSEAQLNQIFELLMTAHYRTRPSDLRTMLDGANVRLFILRQGQTLKAVAMIAQEGELTGDLAAGILQGKRRPHGQVLPQTLAVHLGQDAALAQKHWRVVRIAVQPDSQRRGLGTDFLQRLTLEAAAQGMDTIGSLFSGDQSVLAFWQRNHFRPLRVGYTREATTGAHSLLVLKGLSPQGHLVEQESGRIFADDFPLLLLDSHRHLPAEMILTLMEKMDTSVQYYERDQVALRQYLSHCTPYENVAPSLWRLLWGRYPLAGHGTKKDIPGYQLVVMKVLQNLTWESCIEQLALTGIKEARTVLRQSLEEWVQ